MSKYFSGLLLLFFVQVSLSAYADLRYTVGILPLTSKGEISPKRTPLPFLVHITVLFKHMPNELEQGCINALERFLWCINPCSNISPTSSPSKTNPLLICSWPDYRFCIGDWIVCARYRIGEGPANYYMSFNTQLNPWEAIDEESDVAAKMESAQVSLKVEYKQTECNGFTYVCQIYKLKNNKYISLGAFLGTYQEIIMEVAFFMLETMLENNEGPTKKTTRFHRTFSKYIKNQEKFNSMYNLLGNSILKPQKVN